MFPLSVFAFNRMKSCWGCKHGFDIIFVNDFPKDAGVGCADGFAFVKDGCGAIYQRGVNDVCVPRTGGQMLG